MYIYIRRYIIYFAPFHTTTTGGFREVAAFTHIYIYKYICIYELPGCFYRLNFNEKLVTIRFLNTEM